MSGRKEKEARRALQVTRSGPRDIPAADYYEVVEEFDVASWTPAPLAEARADPNGKGKPTQVHMRFGTPPGQCMLVRFKSPRSLDGLIAALIEHREYVWGPRQMADIVTADLAVNRTGLAPDPSGTNPGAAE